MWPWAAAAAAAEGTDVVVGAKVEGADVGCGLGLVVLMAHSAPLFFGCDRILRSTTSPALRKKMMWSELPRSLQAHLAPSVLECLLVCNFIMDAIVT